MSDVSNEPSDWVNVHIRLRAAIGNRSRRQLARDANITIGAMDHIMAGKSEPSFSRVMRLASVLGISLDWLACGLGDQHLDLGLAAPRTTITPREAPAQPYSFAPPANWKLGDLPPVIRAQLDALLPERGA